MVGYGWLFWVLVGEQVVSSVVSLFFWRSFSSFVPEDHASLTILDLGEIGRARAPPIRNESAVHLRTLGEARLAVD